MGTLYLVRHGQASFGAEDYDQLSELGAKQSERLGQYLAGKGLTFDAALCGTLRRQIGTCDGILRGGGYPLEARHWPGLNEFDSHAIIATVHPHPLEKTDSPERYREHFRLLRDGLRQWMNGVVSPKGMPPYQEFRQGVVEVLDHIRKTYQGNVLLVSSGGPISTAVGHVLATSPETTIELNLRIRNSSVTEFEFNPKRHTLVTYNTLPHLDTPELASWITYS
ncbi:MAG: histidine phosphatase family protein [Rhodoferax sp.]|nr:histidine phosphatase family protein [Rhodoferax sp.]